MSKTDSKKRVAVVAGASGYVGKAIIEKLAADGFRVAALIHGFSKSVIGDFLTTLPGSGHKTYICDICSAEEVDKTIAAIEKDMGPIYVSICAAGTGPDRKRLYLSSAEEARKQFEVNFFGCFNFLSVCARAQKIHGAGVMVGITTAALASASLAQGLGAYAPAKSAIQETLSIFREELAPYGVRVHAVAPGFMSGGMNSSIPKAFIEMAMKKSPNNKLADASDVAEAVSLLCSNVGKEADFLIFVAPELNIK